MTAAAPPPAGSPDGPAADPEPPAIAAAAPSRLLVLAATGIEARAIRRALGGHRSSAHVVRAGMALRRRAAWPVLHDALAQGVPIVVCGICGALRDDIRRGAVVIPEWAALPDGRRLDCDPALVAAATAAARQLGLQPHGGALLTASRPVTGASRGMWAEHGFSAVDMETARLLDLAPEGARPRVAAVRAVLDTPRSDLSSAWERPSTAVLYPWMWPQAAALGIATSRLTAIAAAVVAAMLSPVPSPSPDTAPPPG